ncbi:metalloregulator ArsR/SmtB family transcription factor [Clostridium botulinum]
MDEIINLFKALSDETRVRILILLYKQKLCVCQMCGIMGESQPKISKHLARLKSIGLIKDERQEQFIYYYLNYENELLKDLLHKIILNLENSSIIKKDLNNLECAGEYIISKE